MAIDIANRLMAGLMTDYGLTREQAAGFVGNLAHESAGFRTLQEVKPLVPGSRGGYGYAQWTGPRRRQFEAWSQQQGLDPSSFEANYGFLRHELDNTNEGAFLPKLRNARSVDEAAKVVERGFLRPGIPHTESRIKWANRILGGDVPAQAVAQAQPPVPTSANGQNVNRNNAPLPKAGGFLPKAGTSATPASYANADKSVLYANASTPPPATPAAPTVARLLGTDQPRVTALLAALAEQGNEQQQQQPTDPRQAFAANYAWARANGWRV